MSSLNWPGDIYTDWKRLKWPTRFSPRGIAGVLKNEKNVWVRPSGWVTWSPRVSELGAVSMRRRRLIWKMQKKKVLTIFMLEHCQKQEQLSNLINNLQLGLFHLRLCFRTTVNPQSCRNAVLTWHPHNSLSHLLGSWLTITGHWYNLDNWQLILMPPHLAKISFESPSPLTSPSLHRASCFSSSRDSLSPPHRASFSSLCQRHGRRFSWSRPTTLSQKPISSSWLTAQMPSCWNAVFCFAALCRCLREGGASFTDWRFEEQPKKGVYVSFMFAIGVSCRI